MDIYSTMISHIVKKQQSVIGPLAIQLANNVGGLTIDSEKKIQIKGNPQQVVTNLVTEFEKLFGQVSIEVCKDAVKEIKPSIPLAQIPEILH